jgi:glycosyltransferase involved in cell wall biosynthesis
MNAKPLIYNEYEPPKNRQFTIKFIGTIDRSRNLLPLIDVVKEYKDMRCIIAGKGYDKAYIQKIKNRCENTNNCSFIGYIPMQSVISETRSADVVYYLTTGYSKNIKWPVDIDLPPNFALANKVFESMVTGRPIIVGKDTYGEIFTKKIGSGISSTNKIEDIRDVILTLKNNPDLCKKMGKKGFRAAKEKYNWEKQEEKLLEIYETFCL